MILVKSKRETFNLRSWPADLTARDCEILTHQGHWGSDSVENSSKLKHFKNKFLLFSNWEKASLTPVQPNNVFFVLKFFVEQLTDFTHTYDYNFENNSIFNSVSNIYLKISLLDQALFQQL